MSAKMKKVGKDMTEFGKKIALRITAPIALLGVLSVRTFINFEKSPSIIVSP